MWSTCDLVFGTRNMNLILTVSVYIVYTSTIVAGCGDLGSVSPSSGTLGSQTEQTFFTQSTASTCCGLLSQWKFYASATGTLTAIIWRPVSGSTTNFELVAKDDFIVTALGLHAKAPVTTSEIDVGDHIGWYSSAEIVPYNVIAGSSTQNQLLATGPTLSSQISWGLPPDTTNQYSFGAHVVTNTAPSVTDASITVSTSETSQTVHPLTVTDTDTTTITDLTVVCTSGCTSFSLVPTATGWDIQSGASLTTGTHTLVITATDRCGDIGTGTITITVSNLAPVFDPTPMQTIYSTSISDSTTIATSLYSFSVTDSDPITCSLDNNKFEIQYNAPNFELWLKAGADTSLNYDSGPSESMTISCTDSNTAPITSSYVVNISDEPPVLSGVGGTSGPIGDLSAVSTTVHQLTVTDQDDIISCLVDAPENAVFDISTSTGTGAQTFDITTKIGLNYDTSPSYTVSVSCNDGENAAVTGSQIITIHDDAPTLTGLPATTSTAVQDGAQAAANLGQFSVTDANDQAGITCIIQAPNNALFEIQTGTAPEYQVWSKTGVSLDASAAPYILTIDCVDDETANVQSGTFTVPISNQAPVFVNLPASNTASPTSDCTSTDVQVHTFSVTDTEAVTCSLAAAIPYNDDIDLRGTSPDYEIWALGTNDFNYNTDASIPITVTCTDVTNTVTDTFTLTLYDEDPVVTGLPAAAAFTGLSDAETAVIEMYTFQVDDCVDTITCQVDPSTTEATSFQVEAGTAPDFKIKYRGRPPAILDSSVATTHTLTIICSDGASFTTTLSYNVELANAPPAFVNLPDSSVTLPENAQAKLPIFTFTVTDTTEVDCTFADTVAAAGIHSIEKSTVVLPNTEYIVYANSIHGFDFESSPGFITVDITCGDTTNTITETLTVNIGNAAPVISNPGGTATIDESKSGAVNLKIYSIETFDSADTTCSVTDTDGGPFAITGRTLMKTPGTLDYEIKSSYNLVITCTDGLLTTSDTYTVNVQNEGPDITNLPIGGDLDEDQVAEKLLVSLTTSEAANDCQQVAPVQSEFVVKLEPTTNLWTIYYVSQAVAGKTLDYETTPSYDITVICSDFNGAQGSPKTYTISIVDNETPVITNIVGNQITQLDLVAKDVGAFDSVFQVASTDNEADDVTYTLQGCEPAVSCPFRMTSNGDVSTNSSLDSWPNDYYQLTINAADDYNTDGVTKTLIVQINDINTIPILTNAQLPDVVSFDENNAIGDVVYDIEHYDPDEGDPDTLIYTCDFIDGGETYFECDTTTGEIKAKSVLDYESISQTIFHVEVKVNDGYADSTIETLAIQIDEVNEQPTFTKTFTLTKNDEGAPGDSVGCPELRANIDDDDINDLYTYTMSCPGGEGMFVMDDIDGCVTMTREWDLDKASKRLGQETIACTVTVTDREGLTDTTTMNIVIKESDDNIPYLDKTSYHYCATVNTTSGGLGVPVVDDNDVLAAHKNLTFQLIGSGPGIVDGNGVMTYGDVSSYSKGTYFTQTLRVTDGAGHSSESEVTILICDPQPVTTTSTSNTSSSSSSTSDSILAWILPAAILGLLTLALLGFLLWRYCSGRCCAQSEPVTKKITRIHTPRNPTPPREKKPKQGVIAPVELPITFYYARDVGNMGKGYPMS